MNPDNDGEQPPDHPAATAMQLIAMVGIIAAIIWMIWSTT